MLAVVSMALVSCGGGGGGLKPAKPAITYSTSEESVDLKDCLKVESVAIRKSESFEVIVSAKVEMIKEPSEPFNSIKAAVEVLDENEAQICRSKNQTGENNAKYYKTDAFLSGVSHKGDVGTVTWTVYAGIGADKVVEDARFVRLLNARAL